MKNFKNPSFSISYEHLVEVLEVGKLNVWIWDLATNKVMDFGCFKSLSIFKKDKDIPSNIAHFLSKLHREDRENIASKLEKSLNNYENFNAEFRIQLNKKRAYEWVVVNGHYLFEEKNPTKMIGIWRFITKEKNNQELIELQQIMLQQLLANQQRNECIDKSKLLTASELHALEMIWKEN
ncbi:MAG: PAS domain-containing protein [Tatlockia sp.]|nr:PAS domain-containing protein [Tatlockia sp.]